jgi:hypothetical protein
MKEKERFLALALSVLVILVLLYYIDKFLHVSLKDYFKTILAIGSVSLMYALLATLSRYLFNRTTGYISTTPLMPTVYIVCLLFMILSKYIALSSSLFFLAVFIVLYYLFYRLEMYLKERERRKERETQLFEVSSLISIILFFSVILLSKFQIVSNRFISVNFETVSIGHTVSILFITTFSLFIILPRIRDFQIMRLGRVAEESKGISAIRLRNGARAVILLCLIYTSFYIAIFLFLDPLIGSLSERSFYDIRKMLLSCFLFSAIIVSLCQIISMLTKNVLSVNLLIIILFIVYCVFGRFFDFYSPFRSNR